jgi:HAE1 family hydrophobic/amphiphilic exporter-1
MRISAWAIRHPIPVTVLMIALTLAGIVAYNLLPIKRFPNLEFPVVTVSVTQSGAAPSEMEEQITRPVEDALTGIAGLRHTSSTVMLGSSTTAAEFEISPICKRRWIRFAPPSNAPARNCPKALTRQASPASMLPAPRS